MPASEEVCQIYSFILSRKRSLVGFWNGMLEEETLLHCLKGRRYHEAADYCDLDCTMSYSISKPAESIPHSKSRRDSRFVTTTVPLSCRGNAALGRCPPLSMRLQGGYSYQSARAGLASLVSPPWPKWPANTPPVYLANKGLPLAFFSEERGDPVVQAGDCSAGCSLGVVFRCYLHNVSKNDALCEQKPD